MAENPFKKAGSNPFAKGGGGTAPKKEEKKSKGFFGIDLPGRLPAIGVTTDKKNPLTQVEDLVTGLPANLIRLGVGVAKESNLPANIVRAQREGGGLEGFKKVMPVSTSIIESMIKTGKTLNPQDLTDVARGDFAKTALGKRVKEEGVLGTGLATVSDISMLAAGAGLLGKAAGAGNLAKAANLERAAGATTKAAGLEKGVNLSEAATKAAGRGAVRDAIDLEKAAGQLDEAGGLRAASKGKILPKITEVAQDVGRLGNQMGNIPAKPYQLLAKGAAKLPQGIGTAVEAAVEKGLPGATRAEKMVQGVSNVVKYAGDKSKIADLYYKNVTAPTTEALYRRLERGEGSDAIRANLISRFPGSEAVFTKMFDDLKSREERVNQTRPKGQAEKLQGTAREIWSKSPEEWQADLDGATAKLQTAKAARSALPDGDEGYKAAGTAVNAAQKEVTRLNAMRKMSMQEPVPNLPKGAVPEPETPVAAVGEDTVPAEGTPAGPSFEEMSQFNTENVKAVRAEFHAQVQDQFAPGITAKDIVPDTSVQPGSKVDLGEVLKARDYTAWDPTTGMELKAAQITPDSAVIPNQVFDEITRYSKYNQLDKANSKLLKAYDAATGTWKHTVLALSPRWHVGNIAGNLAMAMAAGLGPIEIVKRGIEASKMLKTGEIPAELLASGFHFSEQSLAGMMGGPLKGVQKLRHPIQASYQMNQFVDDMNRSMIYLSKKSEGVSERSAIAQSLKAAGDFSRMTPFERNVIRRIVPFYAWQKHITKLVFRLPLEEPSRVAWTLHMAEMGERIPDEGAEGFNENTVGIGGQRLNLNALNPFASAIGFGAGKDAVTRAVNPLIGLGLAATTGASTKRGLEGVTTPERDFGDAPRPLLGNPTRLMQYISQQIPTTRQLQDLGAGTAKSRFDTGQERPTQYPADAQGREQQLLNFLGIGLRRDLKGAEAEKVTKKKGDSSNPFAGKGNPFKKK